MKTRRCGALGLLLLAACLILLGALVWEAAASVWVQPVRWGRPAIVTSTAGAAAASGWWQSMPTQPLWPTAHSTETATPVPGDTGETPK